MSWLGPASAAVGAPHIAFVCGAGEASAHLLREPCCFTRCASGAFCLSLGFCAACRAMRCLIQALAPDRRPVGTIGGMAIAGPGLKSANAHKSIRQIAFILNSGKQTTI